MKITKHRERVERIIHQHAFNSRETLGAGYAFDCDDQGVIDESALTDVQRGKGARCIQIH
jgi:hypothetical protein